MPTIAFFFFLKSHLLENECNCWMIYNFVPCNEQFSKSKQEKKQKYAQKILGHPRHRHKESLDILTIKIKIHVYTITNLNCLHNRF